MEKAVEARKPKPVRVLAIRPGCTNPEWMTVDELTSSGSDVQRTDGNDLNEIKRVLEYMAGPGCVID
jgi:hypothetical protein